MPVGIKQYVHKSKLCKKKKKKKGGNHFRCTKGYALSLVWLKKKRQWEDILRICNPATYEPPASCFLRGQSKGTDVSFRSE